VNLKHSYLKTGTGVEHRVWIRTKSLIVVWGPIIVCSTHDMTEKIWRFPGYHVKRIIESHQVRSPSFQWSGYHVLVNRTIISMIQWFLESRTEARKGVYCHHMIEGVDLQPVVCSMNRRVETCKTKGGCQRGELVGLRPVYDSCSQHNGSVLGSPLFSPLPSSTFPSGLCLVSGSSCVLIFDLHRLF